MKSISPKVFAITLSLTLWSCVSASLQSPLSISEENRKYEICPDLAGFCWNYEVCAKKILGICWDKKLETLRIDAKFKDVNEAKRLYDMNFVLQVRKTPL